MDEDSTLNNCSYSTTTLGLNDGRGACGKASMVPLPDSLTFRIEYVWICKGYFDFDQTLIRLGCHGDVHKATDQNNAQTNPSCISILSCML